MFAAEFIIDSEFLLIYVCSVNAPKITDCATPLQLFPMQRKNRS